MVLLSFDVILDDVVASLDFGSDAGKQIIDCDYLNMKAWWLITLVKQVAEMVSLHG